MLFSQYVEDITKNFTKGDNYKVIPTKFIALDIDYSKLNKKLILQQVDSGLEVIVKDYIQNCFENACAYGRSNYLNWSKTKDWNPEISRNLFWNCMFDGKLISSEKYGSETSNTLYIPEVMYYGDINMHSYNEHKGMGYGEIYCYIPTNAGKMNCQVIRIGESTSEGRLSDKSNINSKYLVGFEGDSSKKVDGYPQEYYYNRDFSMSFDDEEITRLENSNVSKYNINTIIVLYSVFEKVVNEWVPLYSNIPMGMYLTGTFDENGKLSNEVTKYVTTSYDTGTSYGLRICTRFTSTSNNAILSNSDIIVDNSSYTNICQMMTAMNENLSKMREISNSAIDNSQQYKELLNIFKNNRTNVPYVKEVNGVDCWFVNGRFVSAVNTGVTLACAPIDSSVVEKRIENIKDSIENNEFLEIKDPNYIECDGEINSDELAKHLNKKLPEYLKLNPDDYPDKTITIVEDCKHEIVDDDTVKTILHIDKCETE